MKMTVPSVCVEMSCDSSHRKVTVVVSRSGSDATLTRIWRGADQSLVSVAQLEDIKAWVIVTLENALLAWYGAQEQLFPTP